MSDPNSLHLKVPKGNSSSGSFDVGVFRSSRVVRVVLYLGAELSTIPPDLSESPEDAGGVGGLLAIERREACSSTCDIRFPHYDDFSALKHAQGDIIALTDNAGKVSARYRYDAD